MQSAIGAMVDQVVPEVCCLLAPGKEQVVPTYEIEENHVKVYRATRSKIYSVFY